MDLAEFPPLLTISQVSKICQCSRDTVRKMIRSDALPAVRLGPRGDWRIPKAAVQKLVQA